MSEVSFYILDSEDPKHLLHLVCNLVSKAYTQTKGAFVLMQDKAVSMTTDELLWLFPRNRFLPHRLLDDDEQPGVSIIINDELPASCTQSFLFNAKNIVAPDDHQFERIFDLVLAPQKSQARERYVHYRKLNYKLSYHKIMNKQLNALIETLT